jgi:D-aminopeptidase
MRARELGIVIGTGTPGPFNAITDVGGVRVGQTTLISGDGPLVVGQGPVRTGVTVVLPCDEVGTATLFAGCHRLNGNGELTGLEWVRESGLLTSPIAITNTNSVGVVRDALVASAIGSQAARGIYWSLPVVGETWDGALNDINGMHVSTEHCWGAMASAASGPVAEGNVGGGTGMICHGFKGGVGTSSRVVDARQGGYTVGALVQANHGRRERLTVAGVPVGVEIPVTDVPAPAGPGPAPGAGSIIVVVATDAPLLPHQCTRLAQRAGLGIARVGGVGEHLSGDLFIAFATGNVAPRGGGGSGGEPDRTRDPLTSRVTMLADENMTALFDAVVDATEEAIVNALIAAETMTGRDGVTAHALPHLRLVEAMQKYGRV